MSVNFYSTALKPLEDRSKFAVATVVRSPGGSRVRTGAKMLIFPDGSIKNTVGGGAFEARVVEVAREILEKGKSRVVTCELDPGAAPCSIDIAAVSTEKTADIFIEV
ncbi:XdhC family protein, partial [Candidatus Hakubella thermalkaliphila]